MFAASLGNFVQTLILASRNLIRQRRRTALALLIVGGGVVTFLQAGGFINWVLESMRESTIHSQLGHIQITRPGYFREGLGDPYSYLLPASTEAITSQPLPALRTVAPRLAFNGLLSKGEDTISFIGEGIDPALEAPISRAITIADGKGLADSPPNSVILGVGLAANISARPGDTIVLLATTAQGGINAVELTVSGLFATTTKAYDDTALRVPIDVARKLMKVEGATSWVLLLEKTEQTRQTLDELRQLLPPDKFEVVPWSDLADFYNKTVTLFSQQVGVIRILIALIVILSISNTLTMAVIERTAEIGTCMAIGVRRRSILAQFVIEGALLGFVGGLVGVAVGTLVAVIVSLIGIPMPPPPGMAMGFIGEISVSPALALDAFLLAFLTTLLASIFPAWKASRMIIVDALRHQR